MSTRRPMAIDELVPIAERLRHLHVMRLVLVGLAAVWTVVVPETREVPGSGLVQGIAAYVVVTTLGSAAWHMLRSRSIALFGALLIVDGAFLAWASWATGGSGSPVRYLVVLHVVTVALLASYRTAMKMAMWHSLLAVCVLYAQRSDILSSHTPGGWGTPFQQLAGFMGLVWVAALATGAFAAVNERELRRRKLDLEDLANLAATLERAGTRADVATALRDSLMGAYAFPQAVVLVVERDEVVVAAGSDKAGWRMPLSSSDRILNGVWAQRSARLVSKLDPSVNPHLADLMGDARNLLVVPLFADGKAIGVVVAEHGLRRGSRIERRVVTVMERFCDHAALALRSTKLLDELRAVAATDGLTGVANRRTFDEALRREMARTDRSGEPTSLVMIDIDHFKLLNDRFGHQTGDAVLQAVAGELTKSCRVIDIVARYGGEEFAVVLPNCPTGCAVETAERLRAALTHLDVGIGESVTASFGVATYPFQAAGAEALVAAADGALYEAKRAGRDRVTVASAVQETADHNTFG